MRLFASFRDDRALLRKSAAFASVLMGEPATSEVEWLSQVATRGDVEHAEGAAIFSPIRRYPRGARYALDDRTPSEVLVHSCTEWKDPMGPALRTGYVQFTAARAYRRLGSRGTAPGASRARTCSPSRAARLEPTIRS